MNQPDPSINSRLSSVRCASSSDIPTQIVVSKANYLIDRLTGDYVKLDLPPGTLVNIMTHDDACKFVDRCFEKQREPDPSFFNIKDEL